MSVPCKDCFQSQVISIQQNQKCFFHTQEWMQKFLQYKLDPIHEIQVEGRSIPVTRFVVRAVRDDCVDPDGNEMGSIDFSWQREWSPSDKAKLDQHLEQIRELLSQAQFVEEYKHDQARLQQLGFWQMSQKTALQKKLRKKWDGFQKAQKQLGQINLLELKQDERALSGLLQRVTEKNPEAFQDVQKVNRFQDMTTFLEQLKGWLYPGSICRYTLEISFVLSEPIMEQELRVRVPQAFTGLVPPGLLHLGAPDHYNYYNQEKPEANCKNDLCIHRQGAAILSVTFRDIFQPASNTTVSPPEEVEVSIKAPVDYNNPRIADMAQEADTEQAVPLDDGPMLDDKPLEYDRPVVAAKPLVPLQIEDLFQSGALDEWLYTKTNH